MNTLTKLALGLLGQLKARPAVGDATGRIDLPPVSTTDGMPLMQALARRQSLRAFDPAPLPLQILGELLWAGTGVNRATLAGRTAPSAMNAQEVEIYVALPAGLYRYAAPEHALQLVHASDVRRLTGYQDFVDRAPLALVFVADHARMKLIPATQRASCAAAAAGAMAQNVYLYCASTGLATVLRGWIDRTTLAPAMGLNPDQHILLSQTVGWPQGESPA